MPRSRSRTSAVVRGLSLVLVSTCLPVSACSKSTPTGPDSQPTYQISEFVSGLSSLDGVSALARSGSAPQAGSGPAVTPEANANVINGGSLIVRARAGSPFQVVYFFIGGSGRPTTGFWELRLPSPTTDTLIIVTFGRSIPVTAFDCVLAVATANGPAGAYRSLPSRVVAAGTGDVQVSASWDAASDVDLHVIDPFGEEIYYGDSVSGSGGELDLDSNAGCNIDGVNNENIRWPAGRAPQGAYTVRLDYWSNCGVPSTNYVVTVNRGGSALVFRGTFTGGGDRGGRGSGRHITTFSHGAGLALLNSFPGLRRPEAAGRSVRPESVRK